MTDLEQILKEDLRQVNAPGELWDRVEVPVERARHPKRISFQWVVAATALAGVVFGIAWHARNLSSGNASEIKAWVLQRTGLNLPLYHQPPSNTRLTGAKLAGFGVAEVSFLAGTDPAVLRVERTSEPGARHGELSSGSASTSWVFQGQRFTLEAASPMALQGSCRLCHG